MTSWLPLALRLGLGALVLAIVWKAASRRAHATLADAESDVVAIAAMTWSAALLAATAFLLGAFGWLRDWSWALAAVAASAGLARATPPLPYPSERGGDDRPSRIFLVALGGLLIGRAVFGLRNPPADFDSLQYHLPLVAHWLQTGSLGAPVMHPPLFGAFYPATVEVFSLAAAWLTGRDTLLTWPGILALGVLALALRRVARLAGARSGVAEALALCLAASPGITQLTLGVRAENPMAAWFASALLFAIRFRRERRPGDVEATLLALGLFAGGKATGPVLAAFLLFAMLGGDGLGSAIGAAWRRPAALIVAIGLASFWPVRNWIAAGNPLFPAQLRIGPSSLPGLESMELLRRTSVLETWSEGYVGQFNLSFVHQYFGFLVWAVAIGLLLAVRGARQLESNRDKRRLVALTALMFGAYLMAPFTGSTYPAHDGLPPSLSRDNLRFFVPVVIAALPAAAAGLSLARSSWVLPVLAAIFLGSLGRKLGHVLPGIALAGTLAWTWSRFPRRRRWTGAAAVMAGALATFLATLAVEPMRELAFDRIWDGYRDRGEPNASAATVRRLRRAAAGHPVAIVGARLTWNYYGRDFSGQPVYVPVAEPLPPRSHRFEHEDRARAHREIWMRNLAIVRPAFLVTVPFTEAWGDRVGIRGDGPCPRSPLEAAWCDAEPERFAPWVEEGCVKVSSVLPE